MKHYNIVKLKLYKAPWAEASWSKIDVDDDNNDDDNAGDDDDVDVDDDDDDDDYRFFAKDLRKTVRII